MDLTKCLKPHLFLASRKSLITYIIIALGKSLILAGESQQMTTVHTQE